MTIFERWERQPDVEEPRSPLATIGVVLVVIIAVAGLVWLAACLATFVFMLNYGSNK